MLQAVHFMDATRKNWAVIGTKLVLSCQNNFTVIYQAAPVGAQFAAANTHKPLSWA